MINPSYIYLEQRLTPLTVMLILFTTTQWSWTPVLWIRNKSAKCVIHSIFFLKNYRNRNMEYREPE
jgi:hypothetical protein